MTNEVVLRNIIDTSLPDSYEAFMLQSETDKNRLTGQGNTLGNSLPRLKINYDQEYTDSTDPTAKAIPLTRGVWKISVPTSGDTVGVAFATTALFRPYTRVYRYSIYDKEKNTSLLNSSMFKTWGDAVIDDTGMEFKATKYKKAILNLHPEWEKMVKCEQCMFGTVTLIDAKDMHGVSLPVKDVPCLWVSKGSGFMPVSDAITDLTKRSVAMYSTEFNMTTKREKNGTLTFFVPVMTVSKQGMAFSSNDFTLLKSFSDTIKGENSYILDKFKKITSKVASNKAANEFAGVAVDLGEDFNDAIPE